MLRESVRTLGGGPSAATPPTHLGLPESRSLSHAARPRGRGWKLAFQSCSLYCCGVVQIRQPCRAQKGVPWTNVPPWTAVATCSWSSHAGPFPLFAQSQKHVPTCKSLCLHPWNRDKSSTDPTGLYNFFALRFRHLQHEDNTTLYFK